MLIVGELINSTRKKVREAMESRDAEFIKDLAKKQADAGANFIDVNAGAFADKELEVLEWTVKTIREAADCPLCIDSPRPAAVELGLKLTTAEQVMVNSISAEKDKYDAIIPLVKEFNTSVIALCMDDSGMPEDEESVFAAAASLINRLMNDGVPPEKIYVDPLIRPISTRSDYAVIPLNTIEKIKIDFPNVNTICGLSNVSFGLPKRKLINETFLILLLAKGLDAAIIDPLDARMMASIYAAEALLSKDEYCMSYLYAERGGKFEGVV